MYNKFMEMEPLIQEINELTKNEYKFALKSAFLDKSADFCVLEILYRDGILLTKQIKEQVESHILSLCPQSFKYEIKFIKNFISEERINDDFKVFMEKTFPSISYSINSVKLESGTFNVSLSIDTNSYSHAKNKNFEDVYQKYFKSRYEDYNFTCDFSSDTVYVEDEVEKLKASYKEEVVDTSSLRVIEFFDTVHLVGDEIEGTASYIKDKTMPEESVVVCGTIKSVKEIIIKRKPKKKTEDETDEESSEQTQDVQEKEQTASEDVIQEDEQIKYQRKMYKWTLEDFTGSMSCVFFSNKDNQAKVEKLDVGSVVVLRGKLEEDNYSGGVSLKVHDIAYCSIPEGLEEYIVYKQEKPFYEFVEPEPIITYAQDDLMSFALVQETPKYLKDKTFVCFDFETTGLHFEQGDKIIEIGAIKIVDGKITEKFMSYVDPEKPIPAESSAISGIVDADVQEAPKDYQILQDFYKFTRGATIIGYNNINFDNVFLIGQGKMCGYNFDNETEDVYRFAQKYVHGVKNYKLGTIAAKLGVTLDNAHRAVYDALATAEVFIKLAPNII